MAVDEYTAAELSDLSGVAPGTLRVWQSRYGFPTPIGSDGGRNRYSREQLGQVTAVVELRNGGMSLGAAIERATRNRRQPPPSMFASLRKRRPDLPVQPFPKKHLIALSHAIEDEHGARATGGILIGSFQYGRHYRSSERRWRMLARTASVAVVLADFDELAEAPLGPIEVPLPAAHPLEREWTVVLHAPDATAMLAAWEVPTARDVPERERPFEAIWSCDPAATRAAVEAAITIIEPAAPSAAERLAGALRDVDTPIVPDPNFTDELTARAFAYLAAL